MTPKQIKIFLNNKKLLLATFSMIVGLIFLGHFLLKEKIDSKSDLVDVKATLRDFSFGEYHGYGRHIQSYYLFLDRYNNKFQIAADFVDYFDKEFFMRTVKIGDTLRICVSSNDFSKREDTEKVEIFGIYKKNLTYLACENAIIEYNSKLTLYSGLILIFVGLILFFINRDKLSKTNIKLPPTSWQPQGGERS